jgi:fructokinase
MIFVIGEILFDIFPEGKRLGGAPFNFAYHLKRFGYPVHFISRIGNDENGREILTRIESAGFDPCDIQIDDTHPTGTVQVQLNDIGVPSFNITPSVAFDFIEYLPEIHSKLLKSAELLYFGTIVQRTDHGFSQLQKFLSCKKTNCISFYDINLRPDCYSDEILQKSLCNADILKCNAEELQKLKQLAGSNQAPPSFIRHIMAEYSIESVALTKGHDGSEFYTKTGSIHHTTVASGASIVDTVGAGDAFAAILAMGLLKGWPSQKTISMATEFASRICAVKGAIPESKRFYEPVRTQIQRWG